MNYYKTNAVYESLKSEQAHPFVWLSGNAWMLIYGDQNTTPKALVLAFGESWPLQNDIIETAEKISSASGIPLLFVKFDDAAESTISKVEFGKPGQARELNLDQLTAEFRSLGLPVRSGTCEKSVNNATSSAYHDWQRSSLGSIKVTDIDLIRLNTEGEPIEAIELKRSYYPLEKWNPFSDDYVNFNLLLSVCKQSAMKMTIAYNVRQNKPVFNDDASRFALFSYTANNSPVRIGQFGYSDFLTGSY